MNTTTLPNNPGIDDDLLATALVSKASRLMPDDNLTRAIVERFSRMTHADRCNLAAALNGIASVLQQEIRFQPRLFTEHIKVRVSSDDQSLRLQEHLMGWGCGFHLGSYPLVAKTCSLRPAPIASVHITPTGALSLNCDPEWFEESADRAIAVEQILSASSPQDIFKPAATATAT